MSITLEFLSFGRCNKLLAESLRRESIQITKTFIEWAGGGDELKALCLALRAPKALPLLEDCGLFILRDRNEIVAMASLVTYKLNRICVSPQHRKKGYALNLLTRITDLFCKMEKPAYVMSPVDPSVKGLFEKVGWIECAATLNSDGTINMVPEALVESYIQRELGGMISRALRFAYFMVAVKPIMCIP